MDKDDYRMDKDKRDSRYITRVDYGKRAKFKGDGSLSTSIGKGFLDDWIIEEPGLHVLNPTVTNVPPRELHLYTSVEAVNEIHAVENENIQDTHTSAELNAQSTVNESYADGDVDNQGEGDGFDNNDINEDSEDDSDFYPFEEGDEDSDGTGETNVGDERMDDDDIDELLFIEESIYPSGFNFSQLMVDILNREDEEAKVDDEILHHESDSTVSEFALHMKNVFDSYQIPEALVNDVFFVLQRHLPTVNWPLKKRNGTVRSQLNSYVSRDNRSITVDICGGGCTAFIGDNYDLIRCPKCKKDRFYPCHICGNQKSYDDCPHGNRRSQQVFHYRYMKFVANIFLLFFM
jgi:hypothetical protein